MKRIQIETPEKIQFTYTISELGTRGIAYFIDVAIKFTIITITVIILLLTILEGIFVDSGVFDSQFYLVAAFFRIVWFILDWFYFVFFEVIWEGQSPGKKLMKIRVIRSNGEPLQFDTIVLRNLLRAVDSLPILHVFGFLVALIDKKTRRLGDIIADTIVVNEIAFNIKVPDFTVKLSNDEERIKHLNKKLTEDELFILRRYLNEKDKVPKEKRKEIAHNLAKQITLKLEIEYGDLDPEIFIERVYKEHGS